MNLFQFFVYNTETFFSKRIHHKKKTFFEFSYRYRRYRLHNLPSIISKPLHIFLQRFLSPLLPYTPLSLYLIPINITITHLCQFIYMSHRDIYLFRWMNKDDIVIGGKGAFFGGVCFAFANGNFFFNVRSVWILACLAAPNVDMLDIVWV